MKDSHALRRCRVARARKNYHRLAVAAQDAITDHPQNLEPWIYFAHALSSLRLYEKANDAILCALQICEEHFRPRLLRMLKACSLLCRIRKPPKPSPTELLERNWYANCLQRIIDSGKLRSFPIFDPEEGFVISPCAGINDCVILDHSMREGERTREEYLEVWVRDGAERNFPGSLIRPFPLNQATGGYIYHKQGVSCIGCECYDEGCGPCEDCTPNHFEIPVPRFEFPKFQVPLPEQVRIIGGPFLSIHVAKGLLPRDLHEALQEELFKLGKERPDSPVPKYHNIIDPNIAAENGLWIPTEVEVVDIDVRSALRPLAQEMCQLTGASDIPLDVLEHIHHFSHNRYGKCELRSEIPDLDPHKHASLYHAIEEVLNAALPLLANLQLPALLLPGPLQVVVKAQRIALNDGDTYEGVWHEDGLREHVVAIVLYYYGMSESLVGGNIEFASKQKIKLWCGDNFGDYKFTLDGVRRAVTDLPKCIAQIEEGTMIVFNNYAAVHRVLPMIAEGSPGSRNFLAFFVIDQRNPLPLPKHVSSREVRLSRRSKLLTEQLQVRGHFGLDNSEVTTTGNGMVSDIAWIASRLSHPLTTSLYTFEENTTDEALSLVSRLNITPPVIGRGSSFLTSQDSIPWQFNPASNCILHIIDGDEKFNLFVHLQVYVGPGEFDDVPPENGVAAVLYFQRVSEWLEQGYRPRSYALFARLREAALRE